ncbi:MAG: ABC transporter permease [Acidimicrobiia bacterium]
MRSGELDVAPPPRVEEEAPAPSPVLAPLPTGWRRVRDRIDVPVQVGRAAVFVAFVGLWSFGVEQEWVRPLYSATPKETFDRLVELVSEGAFWRDLLVTLREAFSGWLIGSVLGLCVGMVLGRWPRLAKVFGPYLTFANATPKIAFAPLLILWFGIGESSKVALAVIISFFIVQVSTQAAVSLLDPDLTTVATTMGASELQRFRKVILPGILAAVFGAFRLAAVYALLAAVLGEFLASREGLGQRLITSTNLFDMPTAFALIIVLATLALVLNGAVGLVERRLMRWQSQSSRGPSVSL